MILLFEINFFLFLIFKEQSQAQMAQYIQMKRPLDILREQELHAKKMKLLELQIEEAVLKKKAAMGITNFEEFLNNE